MTGPPAAGTLRSWSKRPRSGGGTWTWGAADPSGGDGERPGPLDDRLGTADVLVSAFFDRTGHACQGVLAQQLQDPHEPPRAGRAAVVRLQLRAERGEARRQLPVAEDRCMVQRPGLAVQRREVVRRLQHHRRLADATPVRVDGLAVRHDHDPVDGALDADRPEGVLPGHAVAVAVKGNGLIFVHVDRGADHAGVEPVRRQGRRRGAVLGQAVADNERPGERLDDPLTFGLTALAEHRIEFREVGNARHRGGEPALHGLDGPLGIGLLVAPRRHAEPRGEGVVAGQRRVAGVELALATPEDHRGDRPGVVPPDLPGHGVEELEGGDHPLEDRLGPLEGQRQDERGVGVGPGGHEAGDEPAAVGEIDVDMAEVGLEPLAREMAQGDEGLLLITDFGEGTGCPCHPVRWRLC